MHGQRMHCTWLNEGPRLWQKPFVSRWARLWASMSHRCRTAATRDDHSTYTEK